MLMRSLLLQGWVGDGYGTLSITRSAKRPVEMLLFSLILKKLVSDGDRASPAFPRCSGLYPVLGRMDLGASLLSQPAGLRISGFGQIHLIPCSRGNQCGFVPLLISRWGKRTGLALKYEMK